MMNHASLFQPTFDVAAVVAADDDVVPGCENDPSMIYRGAFHLRRRRTTQRIDDDTTTTVPMTIETTLPSVPQHVVVTPSSQRHDRSKSFSPWICTGNIDAVATSHSNCDDTISPSQSNHHHRRRHRNVSSHHHHHNTTTIRTWKAAVRSTSQRISDHRTSDPTKDVHIHDLTDEIEVTCSMLSLRKTHSKFWRSSQSPTSVLDNITTVTTTTTSSSSSSVRDHDYSVTTPNTTTKSPPPPRAVRFNVDLNRIIDSELSSDDIKEYRKQMWWSHKDRARSMKQRDVDLQDILKENIISTTSSIRPTSTEELLQLERADDDATLLSTNEASSTTTHSEMLTDDHPVLSEYCEAVLTLLSFCQDSYLPQSDENIPIATTPLPKQAIRTIAGSKYRGLERIVGKILQLQNVSLRTGPADSMPPLAPPTHAATIMALDTTIEVVHSHVPSASDDASLTAATMPDHPTPLSTTNTAMKTWTAVYIRKCFLTYQDQLPSRGTNRRDRRPNSDGDDRPVSDFGPDPTNAEMTNRSTLVVPHHHPAVLLRQYYTSFPGHAIAIRWAQLMAMGDEWILVES